MASLDDLWASANGTGGTATAAAPSPGGSSNLDDMWNAATGKKPSAVVKPVTPPVPTPPASAKPTLLQQAQPAPATPTGSLPFGSSESTIAIPPVTPQTQALGGALTAAKDKVAGTISYIRNSSTQGAKKMGTPDTLQSFVDIVKTTQSAIGSAASAASKAVNILSGNGEGITSTKYSLDEKAGAVTDAGLALIGAVIAPAMSEFNVTQAAVGATPVVGKPIAGAVNTTFSALQAFGGRIAQLDLSLNPFMPQSVKNEWSQRASDFGGLIATVAVMHAVGKGMEKIGDIKSEAKAATTIATPQLVTLGLDAKAIPSKAAIYDAYKTTMAKLSEGGQTDVNSKSLIVTSAFHALTDYHDLGTTGFVQKWGPAVDAANALLEQQATDAQQKAAESAHQADVASGLQAREASTGPTPRRPAYQALSTDGKLAYEVDSQNNFQAAVAKEQAKPGAPQIHVVDLPSDPRPGTFDPQTGEIHLNRDAILKLADQAEAGKSMIVGTGTEQYILEMKPTESRAELETRITADIINHEIAHFNSVTPEDAAFLQSARERGDTKAYWEKVQELEQKAGEVMQKPSAVGARALEAANREGARLMEVARGRDRLSSLAFPDTGAEAGYQAWKALAKRSPDVQGLDYPGLRDRLVGKTGYDTAQAVAKRFGLQAGEDTLAGYRERFAKEAQIKAEIKTNIQTKLFEGLSKDERHAQSVVQDEVKKALAEAKAKGDERGMRRGTRNEAATSNRLRSRLEEQKSLLTSANVMDKAILRIQKDAVISKIRAAATTIKEGQRAIIDYAREHFSLTDRKEMMTTLVREVKNAASKADLQEVFARLDADYNRVERKNLVSSIKDELKGTVLERTNGLAKGKFGTQQRALDQIRTNATRPRAEAFAERVANIKASEALRDPITGALPADVVRKNQILETAGVKEQTNSQLRNTLAIIQDLKEKGKTEVEQIQEQRKQAATKNVEMAKRVISGGEEMQAKVVGATEKVNAFKNLLRTYRAGVSPLEYLLDWISKSDKTSEAMNSPLSHMGRASVTANGEYARLQFMDREAQNKVVENAYGVKGVDALGQLQEMKTKKENFGSFKDTNGKSVDLSLTRMEQMRVKTFMDNPARAEQLARENNFTPEMMRAATSKLTPQDLAYIQGNYDFYKSKAPQYAEAFFKDTGTDLGQIPNYIPTSRLGEGPASYDPNMSVADQLAADMTTHQAGYRPGSARLLEYQGKLDLNWDPQSQMRNYASRVNHYTTHIDVIRDFNTVFNNPEVRDMIKQKYGVQVMEALDHQTGMMRRGGRDSAQQNRIVDKIVGSVGVAMINNLTTAAKQPSTGFLQMFGESEKSTAFAAGVAHFFTDPIGHTKLLQEYAPEFEAHTKSQPKIDYTRTGAKEQFIQRTGLAAAAEVGKLPLRALSTAGTAPAAWAVFKETADNAMKADPSISREDAYAIAGRKLNAGLVRVRPTFDLTGKSMLETSGAVGKLLTMFQNHPEKLVLAPAHALEAWAGGRMGTAKMVKIVGTYAVLIPAMTAAGKWAMQRGVINPISDTLAPKTDKEKAARDAKEGGLFSSMGQTIASAPFYNNELIGQFMQEAVLKFGGAQTSFNPSPVLSSLNDLLSGIGSAGKGDWEQAVTYATRWGAAMEGIPLSQETTQGLLNIEKSMKKAQAATPQGKAAASQKRAATARAKKAAK